jgi:hypothetical protein
MYLICNSRIHVITLYSGHVCMYYTSMLRYWHLVWILVKTDHPCLVVECHNSPPPKTITGEEEACYVTLLTADLDGWEQRKAHGWYKLRTKEADEWERSKDDGLFGSIQLGYEHEARVGHRHTGSGLFGWRGRWLGLTPLEPQSILPNWTVPWSLAGTESRRSLFLDFMLYLLINTWHS